MEIVLDEVDGSIYGDIVLTFREFDEMRLGEMIMCEYTFEGKKYYIGARLNRGWSYEEEKGQTPTEEFWELE